MKSSYKAMSEGSEGLSSQELGNVPPVQLEGISLLFHLQTQWRPNDSSFSYLRFIDGVQVPGQSGRDTRGRMGILSHRRKTAEGHRERTQRVTKPELCAIENLTHQRSIKNAEPVIREAVHRRVFSVKTCKKRQLCGGFLKEMPSWYLWGILQG